jgi:hypothetical protein
MWPAQRRAIDVAPRVTLDDLRPYRGEVALRCTLRGCTECATFETEGRAAYERELRARGAADVLHWDCADPARRRVALAAGVDALPAYVIVPSRGAPRVRTPSSAP